MAKQILYEEKQHFWQPLLWITLLGISLLLTYELIQQIFLGIHFGSNLAPNIILIIVWGFVSLLLSYAFWKATLTIRVYPEGIGITFFPIKRSEQIYRFEQITEVKNVTYHPFLSSGDWGIRSGAKGKAYNVQGNKGLKVWFKTGLPVLIGSQRSDQLYSILQNHID